MGAALKLLVENITRLSEIDFSEVLFETPNTALLLFGALGAVVFIRFVISRSRARRITRPGSGYFSDRRRKRRNTTVWILMLAALVPAAAALLGLIAASATPYLAYSRVEEKTYSREICYLQDGSDSMTYPADEGSRISSAELSRTVLLDFLVMRKDEKDRSCFWMFSSNPHKIEDFTTDWAAFFFKVYDARWALTAVDPDRVNAPEGRFVFLDQEGGTNIARAFDAIIPYYDAYARPDTLRKALMITTDTDVSSIPEQQLQQLRDRNILVIVIYIVPPRQATQYYEEGEWNQPTAVPQFISEVLKYGGKVYTIKKGVDAEKELRRAFEDINREIPKAAVVAETIQERVYIHGPILAAAFVLFAVSAFVGILVAIEYEYNI
ncbi:MAG: hypothetical protein A2939_01195 [Parcubacteria group bacterium RIFCSPLOWO2_01_FULL_48_18]|nr:MAG: hypothetical protein A2939_01195 [Parcubacteria group bacterium RIFCSPLOWO2_01_FULL_48_18]